MRKMIKHIRKVVAVCGSIPSMGRSTIYLESE